ncbi:phospholipid phosphatase 3-like isoform X4 [Bos javanicus]|nr:phospholipid phosphatase 3-like isoform X4 [Bos javanicus]
MAHYIIEDSALIKMGFFISIFTISLGELIRVRGLQLSSPAFMSSAYMAMIYKQLRAFIFGGLASFSLTSIAKMTTGQLRPHFLATCLPDPTSFNCENGYITNYSCTGHPEDVLDARMSFYSENASLGMYCMVYLVLYIQAGSWGQKIWLLRPTIQLLFLSLALLTGYIRVLDHWHHPYDAFFGFLQGALTAFWVVSDAVGHRGTGRVCLSGSPWVCPALLTSQDGSAGEARLEWENGHGVKVMSAHHNLSWLHPCRFSTSQAMPSPRATYALCATFLPTSPLCIPPLRTLREPKACPDAEIDRGHTLLSRACAPQWGCPSPRWASPGSPTCLELSPDPRSALPWRGDTGSPIFLGLNPKLAPPSRATFTLCFYVFLLY